MSSAAEFAALERLVRPLSRTLSIDLARALIDMETDPETQARYDALADKNTEGTISATEKEELESLVRANTFLQIVQLQARAALNHAKSA